MANAMLTDLIKDQGVAIAVAYQIKLFISQIMKTGKTVIVINKRTLFIEIR
jgi:hypothetical protein